MLRRLLPAVLAAAALLPSTAAADTKLTGRALLPADASWSAPFAGATNTNPAPAPGARQPVGGFSALLDAPGKDTYYAMPDNGFGSKANSRSFLLRVYTVRLDSRRSGGRGSGAVTILDAITLRDPDHKLGFPIVTDGTPDRLLTGGDLDIESVRRAPDGTLWFGEEFGPFLVHTDATGKVLEAPFPVPGVISPSSPLLAVGQTPNLANSNGFEGTALAADGRTLHPVLEGPVAGDDRRTRRLYTFDLVTKTWKAGYRTYVVDDPSFLVADLTLVHKDTFVSLERDNGQGAAAKHKTAYAVTLAGDGSVRKREVLDELAIPDPFGLSPLDARPGDIGLGDPFAMPYQTIEAVLPIRGGRVAIVNDTNFGSTGRNPARADDSDFIEVLVPGLR
ncbi:MAG TPA: esterase-like activity of phytase family protein [Solirubrobacteraceae bacterium]